MILYHGSNVRIDKIELLKSKPYKDFGRGFYLSDNIEQAEDLARFRALTLGGEVLVTKFQFDENLLSDGTLKFLQFNEYSEEWARFVFRNRCEAELLQNDYDVIYGPIANDRVGFQIQKLEDGSISFPEFLNRIKFLRGITFQYFFGTELAISHLKRL